MNRRTTTMPYVKDERTGVPGWCVAALLMICVLSPYGLMPQGGGTLRPDHLAVYAWFVFLLVTRMLVFSNPLAISLAAVVGVSILATVPNIDDFYADPVNSLKNLDGLLRGPLVLTIASSIRCREADTKFVLRTIVGIALLLCVMALVERALPEHSEPVEALARWYGGAAYDSGVYVNLRLNHKQLMNAAHRASAAFNTPPALSFAAIFFIILASVRDIGLSNAERVGLFVSGILSGIASNSKSFLFGAPVLGLLYVARRNRRSLFLATAVVLGTAAGVGLATAYGFEVNPLHMMDDRTDDLAQMSAGRYSESGSLLAQADEVLGESPLIGFGILNRPLRHNVGSGDVALNMFVLRSGALGVLAIAFGIFAQIRWFRHHRNVSPWATVGEQTLLMSLAFFLGASLFQIARINDITFTILGLSIAMTGRYAQPLMARLPEGRKPPDLTREAPPLGRNATT